MDDRAEELDLRELGARVRAVADRFPTLGAAADAAGLSYQQLRRIMIGEAAPPFLAMRALAKDAGVSLSWLAEGIGPMVPEAQPRPAPHSEIEVVAAADDEFEFVPILDVRAAAGDGAVNPRERIIGRFPVPRQILAGISQPRNLVMISCAGDSMAPRIRDGDLMLVNLKDTKPRDLLVYVVRTGDELLVKRILLVPGGGFTLASEAGGTVVHTLTAEEANSIAIVGRVVASFSRVN